MRIPDKVWLIVSEGQQQFIFKHKRYAKIFSDSKQTMTMSKPIEYRRVKELTNGTE